MPLAADPALFDAAGEKRTVAQIGFVGSSMGRAFLQDIAARFLWKKEMEPMVLSAARDLLENRAAAVSDILARACGRHGYILPFSDEKNVTWLCSYIIHTASMLRRKGLLDPVVPLGLHTFGDPAGWRELLGSTLPAHPDIDYRTECASAYRSVDVSVNITSCQMPTAVNQRVFDVPLCGGFVLSDHQGDLDELFAPNELAVYRTPEELVDNITFYRSHPAERARITSRARERILSMHTYAHRVEKINELTSA
jgi:spore maturation protein CgeB